MSLRAAHAVLSREAMRLLDERTIAGGVASLELMERAGAGIVRFLEAEVGELVAGRASRAEPPSLLILAGPGNNGGDGFVVARLLAARGWDVNVALCAKEPAPDSDPARNLERWRAAAGATVDFDACSKLLAERDSGGYDLVLDALFGTGLDRPLEGRYAELVQALNAAAIPVVAVDTPSGLSADHGRPLGVAVDAVATATLGAAKPGLFVGEGPDHAGRVVVVDIGLLDPRPAGVEVVGEILDDSTSASRVVVRRRTAHKGTTGHVLVAGGALGHSGAVLMAARGALRAGAGLVTMAVPSSIAAATDAALCEAMTIALEDDGKGEIGAAACNELIAELGRFTVAVVGPGMGTGPGARDLVYAIVESFRGPVGVDADGLNLLAQRRTSLPALLAERRRASLGPVVLTPHPGEMGRLRGATAADVQADRIAACLDFCKDNDAVLVLKGAGTLVCERDRLAFNTSGNPGMASPGMGDVLSGVTGALAAVHDDAFDAAALAVYAHGAAADLAWARSRGPGFVATEVADRVPDALGALAAAHR